MTIPIRNRSPLDQRLGVWAGAVADPGEWVIDFFVGINDHDAADPVMEWCRARDIGLIYDNSIGGRHEWWASVTVDQAMEFKLTWC